MVFTGILDRTSPVPVHEQLAHGLRAAILSGAVAGGEAVPSTRALAGELGVARGTVVAAYEILTGEGFLVGRGGSGTVVAAFVPPTSSPTPEPVVPSTRARPRGDEVAAVVDLRPGRPGTRGLADAAWRSAWRQATAHDPASDSGDAAGLAELREQIARHLRRTRGLEVTAEEVVVTAGTSEAVLLAVLARAPRARRLRVGVEDPGYPRVRRILARTGAEVVLLPVDAGAGLDLDAVERLDDLDVLVVTPHHHYPLGSRLDAPARAWLLAWAARTGTLVVEDDYDSEFPHGRAPLPPLRMLDRDRVALVGSFSKVLSPALRCGWIVASGEAGAAIHAARADLDLPVSLVQQHALARYLADGALARHAARRRRDYRHRRDLLFAAFADAPGVALQAMAGGLHATVVLVGPGIDDARERSAVEALGRRGIRVAALSAYYADPDVRPDRPRGFVFGYADPSTPVLAAAVAAMVAVTGRRGGLVGDAAAG